MKIPAQAALSPGAATGAMKEGSSLSGLIRERTSGNAPTL